MQQSKTKPCPECGEERVWVNARARGGHGWSSVLLEQPQRFVPFLSLEKKNWSYVQALTCTFCGYTAFYANDPNDLIPDK